MVDWKVPEVGHPQGVMVTKGAEATRSAPSPDNAQRPCRARFGWRQIWSAPLEKVKAEAERLFQLAQEAYVRSSLPPEPDRDRAEKLCVKMIAEYPG